jgi:cell wall-associated NlpC family hydrolase
MAKKWTGYAAAALTASLTLGGLGTTYGATLTLAGFGSDVVVEKKTDPSVKQKDPQVAAPDGQASAQEASAQAAGNAEGQPAGEKAEGQAAAEAAKAPDAASQDATADASGSAQEEAAAVADSSSGTTNETGGAVDGAASTEGGAADAADEAVSTADGSADSTGASAAEAEAPAEEAAPEIDRSMVDTTGFAKADDYVNVRASGDTEGEVVGTLRMNDSVYIEDVDENGWYKIRSGNVEGYVAGYLIATGEEAQAVADSTAYTYAEVGAETLNVRSDASSDAEVVDMVGQSANLEVVEDLGDWVKVVTDDGIYGYVSADYVNTQTVYPTGETVQEQSEREEQEYLEALAQQEAEYAAYLAEQEAAEQAAYAEGYTDASYTDQAAADAGYTDASTTDTGYTDASYTDTGYTDATYTDTGYTDATYTDTGYTDAAYTDISYTDASYTDTAAQASASSGDVDALYQAYLTAQEAANHPTDEADAIAKANAAIDAYNAYLAACGASETVASVEAAAPAETATDTSTEYVQEESSWSETPQTEAAASASSNSDLGAQIANYATQFVGNPYVYGGSSLTGGADCSGFTMAVFSNFGIGLPHNAAAQSGCGTPVSLSDLQPGDLLFYDNGGGIGHVSIYIGGGSVVHASNPETGIKISSYNYRNPVAAVRCF